MTNEELFRELATRACCEALVDSLQEKSRELAEDVARRMGSALEAAAAQPVPQQRACCRQLRDGALLISNSRTQTEALEALLAAGTSAVTAACGLMVVRGTQASGWSCVGFAAPETFKGATLDCTRGVGATVLNACAGRVAKASELDPGFVACLGLEDSAELLLLPVMLKERVAALLVALSGSADDLAGLELLVQVAQLALELQGHRRVAGAVEAPNGAAAQRAAASEPAASQPEMASAARNESRPSEAERTPAHAAASYSTFQSSGFAAQESAAGTAPASVSSQPGAPALDDAHERGRRFAKLLVEEIKLYNGSKVSEGRANRDLYSRLREDIEKSRAAYQKRYGESVKDVDYFTQELMRILADNDRTLMGAGFPG